MQINATITGIEYKPLLVNELENIEFQSFDINTCPTSCVVFDKNMKFAISKWVSPKRTRSYPYERIYNTLGSSKKITIIPIIKDEGLDGDRDFIQWDTLSLMSLLDVYVILAYYHNAEKNINYKNKITNQFFDNEYVLNKIQEISTYHSSALHWNLKELNENFVLLILKVKENYHKISQIFNIQMHSEKGIETFQEKINDNLNAFMVFSRQKAKEAQNREFVTQQPKESLQTLTKAKITITNYLGGQYFFTVDEVEINNLELKLIEAKHSKSAILPSMNDIKDGLLKMILYTNLKEVQINNQQYEVKPTLLLTSTKLKTDIDSYANSQEIEHFCKEYKLNSILINKLFDEAKINNFIVSIRNG